MSINLHSILSSSKSQEFLTKIKNLTDNELQRQNFEFKTDSQELLEQIESIKNLQEEIEQKQKELKLAKESLKGHVSDEIDKMFQTFTKGFDKNTHHTLQTPSSRKYITKILKDRFMQIKVE